MAAGRAVLQRGAAFMPLQRGESCGAGFQPASWAASCRPLLPARDGTSRTREHGARMPRKPAGKDACPTRRPQFPINRSTNTTCRFFASMANSLPGGGVGIFRMKPTLIIS